MKDIVIKDDFYSDPNKIRNFALQTQYIDSDDLPKNFSGTLSKKSYYSTDLIQKFEELLGFSINVDPTKHTFGTFSLVSENDSTKNIIHTDATEWAAIIYLNPQIIPGGGTNFYQHKKTKFNSIPSAKELKKLGFKNYKDFHRDVIQSDQQQFHKWNRIKQIEMTYNRLVIFPSGKLYHSAGKYFGKEKNSSRLTQVFFFNKKQMEN